MIEMTLKVKPFSQDFSFQNSAENVYLVLCLMCAAQSGGIWAGSWRLYVKCVHKSVEAFYMKNIKPPITKSTRAQYTREQIELRSVFLLFRLAG